jgi:hypothetical protein
MNKKLLEKYVKLEVEYKHLENKRMLLRQEILKGMEQEKTEKIKTAFGSFTRAIRLAWTYTPVVEKIEEKLKITKLREQKQGKAKSRETAYLVYSLGKERDE